jgi:hypothetical protein
MIKLPTSYWIQAFRTWAFWIITFHTRSPKVISSHNTKNFQFIFKSCQSLKNSNIAQKFKFKVFSETQGKPLAVCSCKIKNKLLSPEMQWHRISIMIPKRRNEAKANRNKTQEGNLKSCSSMSSNQGKRWHDLSSNRLVDSCPYFLSSCGTHGLSSRMFVFTIYSFPETNISCS